MKNTYEGSTRWRYTRGIENAHLFEYWGLSFKETLSIIKTSLN